MKTPIKLLIAACFTAAISFSAYKAYKAYKKIKEEDESEEIIFGSEIEEVVSEDTNVEYNKEKSPVVFDEKKRQNSYIVDGKVAYTKIFDNKESPKEKAIQTASEVIEEIEETGWYDDEEEEIILQHPKDSKEALNQYIGYKLVDYNSEPELVKELIYLFDVSMVVNEDILNSNLLAEREMFFGKDSVWTLNYTLAELYLYFAELMAGDLDLPKTECLLRMLEYTWFANNREAFNHKNYDYVIGRAISIFPDTPLDVTILQEYNNYTSTELGVI